MRPDFKHLLTEHERYNSRWVKPSQGEQKFRQREETRLDYEDWAPGGKVGIKKNSFGTRRTSKSLAENLGPLIGFLKSRAGEKWDDIFSEISETCPNDSAVSGHIYQHLWQFVVRSPILKDGKVYDGEHLGSWLGGLVEATQISPRFYVHPETNILTEVKPSSTKRTRREAREKALRDEQVALPDGNFAFKIKGIWFLGVMAAIPKAILKTPESFETLTTYYEYPNLHDALLVHSEGWEMQRSTTTQYNYEHFVRTSHARYGRYVYCSHIRQMNKKELKKAKLTNDPVDNS